MNLAEIQHAIEELPKEQRAALASWLAELDEASGVTPEGRGGMGC
jgi:hypothetical protein